MNLVVRLVLERARRRRRLLLLLCVLQYRQNAARIRPLVPIPDERLLISEWSDEHFDCYCRFSRIELEELVVNLRLPQTIILENRSRVNSFEAMMILCCRLVEPGRFTVLVNVFGRELSGCSRIVKFMFDWLFENWASGLRKWNPTLMSPERCEVLAAAAVEKGAPLDNVACVVDGTVRKIARPNSEQRQHYNGHKRFHAIKYQALVALDGLTIHLHPSIGRRADMNLLAMSGIIEFMQQYLKGANGRQMICYGDLGYGLVGGVLYAGYKNPVNVWQSEFNRRMSVIRIIVEWNFGLVVQYWPQMKRHWEQKLGLKPLGRQYFVATFLTNCLTCLRGGSGRFNKAPKFFSLVPPTLAQYINSFDNLVDV